MELENKRGYKGEAFNKGAVLGDCNMSTDNEHHNMLVHQDLYREQARLVNANIAQVADEEGFASGALFYRSAA